MAFTLHITGPFGSKTVTVETELTIGRTEQASVALDDSGLSRINTTFFVDEGELLVADENSTNGTFLNGERIEGRPRIVKDGDHLKLGTYTDIRVEIGAAAKKPKIQAEQPAESIPSTASTGQSQQKPASKPKPGPPSAPPPNQAYLIATSAMMTLLILIFGGIGIYLIIQSNAPPPGRSPVILSTVIPVRVIDPLGGEDEDDLDDLIASWETAEEEINAGAVADITNAADEEAELNVPASLLADRQRKAFEARQGETGIRPAGLNVPKELFGDGVIKQKAKLREMNSVGYRQPMDFADLAEKRMSTDEL
ncbi:MAG TPA: FHA domain-containing protein, partial [Pyrinomonadaceae bacterium]